MVFWLSALRFSVCIHGFRIFPDIAKSHPRSMTEDGISLCVARGKPPALQVRPLIYAFAMRAGGAGRSVPKAARYKKPYGGH